MIEMIKIPITIFFILAVLVSVGCCKYSPWKKELYINHETETVFTHDKGSPDKTKYKDFYVNESLIIVRINAHDASNITASSPYFVSVFANGEKDNHQYLIINSINIESNLNNKTHSIKKMPGRAFYRPLSHNRNSNMVEASFSLRDDNIYLDFEKKEEITISMDIEVFSKDKSERKIIQYHFIPYLQKGYFKCLTV